MHLGRMIKEIVETCDDPWTFTSNTRELGVVLSNLGAYVELRVQAFEAAEAGRLAEADEKHESACEMLEAIRKSV